MKADYLHKPVRLGFVLFVALGLARAASAGCLFAELPDLAGGRYSTAMSINNSGQIVGYTSFDPLCFGCGGFERAILWSGTTATSLGGYGTSSYAYAINDAGQVAGYGHYSYNSYYFAQLWSGGMVVQLPNASGRESMAHAINNLGQVAGWAKVDSTTGAATVWNAPSGTIHLDRGSMGVDLNDAGQVAGSKDSRAIRWNGTTATILETLGGAYGRAEAINEAGQIVGQSLTSGGLYHATLWNDVAAIDLGSLGGNSNAIGINDAGQVVGTSYDAGGAQRAILWLGGSMVDLNSLLDAGTISAGWTLLDAKDINERGQIIGLARNSVSGEYRSYLLTPSEATVPEPATYSLALAGLGAFLTLSRRRRRTAAA